MSGLRESYDAIIIGAGVGGGAMANQLAAAGATRAGHRARHTASARRPTTGASRRSSTRSATPRRKPGATATVRSSIRRPITMSAAIRSSSAPQRCASAWRISRSCSTRPGWHRPGPSAMPIWRPITMWPSNCSGPMAPPGMDPCEPPRSGPMPYPAIGHEPEIQAFDTRLRSMGLKPFPLPVAIDLHPGGTLHPLPHLRRLCLQAGRQERRRGPHGRSGARHRQCRSHPRDLCASSRHRRYRAQGGRRGGRAERSEEDHRRRSLHLKRGRHQFGGPAAALGQRQAPEGTGQQQFGPAGPQLHGPQQHRHDGGESLQEEQRRLPEVAVHQRFLSRQQRKALSARQCAGPRQAAGRHADGEHEGHSRMPDETGSPRAASTGGSCRRTCPDPEQQGQPRQRRQDPALLHAEQPEVPWRTGEALDKADAFDGLSDHHHPEDGHQGGDASVRHGALRQ